MMWVEIDLDETLEKYEPTRFVSAANPGAIRQSGKT
jgi:hypothetical protein